MKKLGEKTDMGLKFMKTAYFEKIYSALYSNGLGTTK